MAFFLQKAPHQMDYIGQLFYGKYFFYGHKTIYSYRIWVLST